MSSHDEAEIGAPSPPGRPVDAWYALYDAHAEAVWRLVAQLVGPARADVADIVQETFLAAAQTFDQFDSQRGSQRAWLGGIARRQVAIHFRNRRRNTRLLDGAGRDAVERNRLVAWLEGKQEDPPELLGRAETVEEVRDALMELDAIHADALIARYLDDQTIEAMAREQACSVSAVRSRLARARRAFRRVFTTLSHSTVDVDAGER